MRTNARVLSVLILTAVGASDVHAQAGAEPVHAEKIELRVLYIGEAADAQGKAADRAARTRDFAEFLAAEFSSVSIAARDGFDPERARAADVVLLDWPQSVLAGVDLNALQSPLGPRDAWTSPTVLLGSAGLLLAGPWQLKGAYG